MRDRNSDTNTRAGDERRAHTAGGHLHRVELPTAGPTLDPASAAILVRILSHLTPDPPEPQ